MKNSISHILAFALMSLLTLVTTLLIFQVALRGRYIFKTLDKIDYYEHAYENITTGVEDYIVHDELRESYTKFITIDLIKNDIRSILGKIYQNKDFEFSRYNSFFTIINKYNDDVNIDHKYASNIDKIYSKNIFPIKEFNFIHKLHIGSSNVLFVAIILSVVTMFVFLLLFLINRNFKFHMISITGFGIILLLPKLIIRGFKIFDKFLYTNYYYSEFLLAIMNNIISGLFVLGIFILLGTMVYKFIKRKLNKSCLFKQNIIKCYHKGV